MSWFPFICLGYSIFPSQLAFILNYTLVGSLIILYTGVGISFGMNRSVFQYIRILSWKIILIPVAIIAGSLAGGYASGIILGIPTYITVIAAGGMSYYSITGAYLTQVYGIEAGGAAGNMDTMLVPITKFTEAKLGIVTLITGTIPTFLVPIILPILVGLFSI